MVKSKLDYQRVENRDREIRKYVTVESQIIVIWNDRNGGIRCRVHGRCITVGGSTKGILSAIANIKTIES